VTVTVERGEHVLTAVFDDGKANALTFEAITGLRSALTAAIDAHVPLVIAGRSGTFSAGFDLRVMRSGDRDLVRSLADGGFLLFRQMFSAPVPVVATCTGHALAAGALLLLASDYRIGPLGPAQIGLNEIRIGIALPQPAVDMARYRLSPNHLIAATLFAHVVAPEPACEVGYLDPHRSGSAVSGPGRGGGHRLGRSPGLRRHQAAHACRDRRPARRSVQPRVPALTPGPQAPSRWRSSTPDGVPPPVVTTAVDASAT
jgi:enoyl-CoA hydratase